MSHRLVLDASDTTLSDQQQPHASGGPYAGGDVGDSNEEQIYVVYQTPPSTLRHARKGEAPP